MTWRTASRPTSSAQDKATRDAGMEAAMNDPRFSPENSPMPFDGARMIYGGFTPVFEINR
jgi:uncharacterized protein YbaA (DUF1428 family)